MLFNSLEFLLFFPIVCIIYFVMPTLKLRNLFLLAASYYFYMNWEPIYALLLLASTGITYGAALGVARFSKLRNWVLTTGIVSNLLILFFFKYFNFAAENVTALMGLLGIKMDLPEFTVLLPVGISFYIFQALGYMIDVYRGDIKPERNFFTYALFVSFYPQLVAGPIERSSNLLVQFYDKHKFDEDKAISGMTMMLWGYFLKLVVADNSAIFIDEVFNNISEHDGSSYLLASVLFCFQLYGDFAGYSYIAIGCSRVLGFKLMDNFRRPYFFSVSIQDYWKRNHISLTSWFMDYLYYPIVGSSTNLWWWCFAILFTFFISGFWHGAAWTYVVCFSIHGVYLVVCILKEKRQRKFEKKYHLQNNEYWLWLNRLATFCLVAFALIFFRANTLSDGLTIALNLFCNLNGILEGIQSLSKELVLSIIILFLVEYTIEYKYTEIFKKHLLASNTMISISLLFLILFLGNFQGAQFIYFQF